MQIAVLLTCHNRRALTVGCLETLSAQRLPPHTELTVYLVDDGCTDGTAAAVSKRFPETRIVPGDGSLYWCGGMRLAWQSAAAASDYDGYLWLNDDVSLFPAALSTLLSCSRRAAAAGRPGIIVGTTCDPDDGGRPTYGGRRGKSVLGPSGEMQPCETMNGNIVLVPRAVFSKVGSLSPDFRQMFGDFDYGFRARKAGFEIWAAPGFLGECRENPCPPWADPSVPFVRRWRAVHGPKGYPPRENYIFSRRHYGWRGLVRLLKIYLRVLFPGLWDWLFRLLEKRSSSGCPPFRLTGGGGGGKVGYGTE